MSERATERDEKPRYVREYEELAESGAPYWMDDYINGNPGDLLHVAEWYRRNWPDLRAASTDAPEEHGTCYYCDARPGGPCMDTSPQRCRHADAAPDRGGERGFTVGRGRGLVRRAHETIDWAVDLLEMYDEKLIDMGEPEDKVRSPTHLNGIAEARRVQRLLKRELAEPTREGEGDLR